MIPFYRLLLLLGDSFERDTHQGVESEVVVGRIGNQVGSLDMGRRHLT